MSDFRLDGKVALITGAAGAIGSATARLLLAQGAALLLVDIDGRAAEDLAAQLSEMAAAHETDLSRAANCHEAVETCVRRFGRLDILINNVGICPRRSVLESSEEDWERIVGVNQKSMFFSSQAAVPHLRKAKGRIVSVASYAGRAGAAVDACIYSGTKGAIIAMTKAMARELAPDILVNALAPGPVDSDLVRELSAEKLQRVCDAIPLRRLAQPEEVAAAILFLAGPAASYMTGATVDFNGGWYML